MPDGEAAAHDGDDRESIGDQCGSVVDETLAFDDRDQPARDPEPARDRCRGNRIGGGDDGAQHERRAPGEVVDRRVGDRCNGDGGRDYEPDTEQADRPHVHLQLVQGGEEGRPRRAGAGERRPARDRAEARARACRERSRRRARRCTSTIGYGTRSVGAITSMAETATSRRGRRPAARSSAPRRHSTAARFRRVRQRACVHPSPPPRPTCAGAAHSRYSETTPAGKSSDFRPRGGPGWDRTNDLGIKSPLLCRLSYRPRSEYRNGGLRRGFNVVSRRG